MVAEVAGGIEAARVRQSRSQRRRVSRRSLNRGVLSDAQQRCEMLVVSARRASQKGRVNVVIAALSENCNGKRDRSYNRLKRADGR